MMRRNWNDPAIGAAFGNLASLFAPPGAGDMANYALARGRNEENARLAQFYDMTLDPNTPRNMIDRAGIGAGRILPTQTFYSVDQGNATQRYGFDTQAATSRANNAADNARALAERNLMEQGSLTREMLAPVGAGATRFVPPSIAGMFAVPEQQVGAISAAPGERVVTPDGRTIEGAPEALTDEQLRASILGEMPREMQEAWAFGSTPIEQVILGEGEAPVNVTRPQAVGRRPADTNASAERVDNFLAVGPEGQEVRFVGFVRDGQVIDVTTGRPVPNVIRREGTAGGMTLETDGQGGVRLVTGNGANTVSRTTQLQGQEFEAGRAVRELTSIFDVISRDDVGVRGNVNDLLTRYGAQLYPDLARGDVTGVRNQMQATSLALARSIVNDERLSDGDRRAAQAVMVDQGLGESLESARAKLASLIVLQAYRQRAAGAQLGSGPINGKADLIGGA